VTIKDFIDQEYRAHVETTLAASTGDGYRKLWKGYGDYFANCELSLRVFEAQKILRLIAVENPHLTKSSLRHIKTFMGGVFSHAQRCGLTESNPWAGRAIAIPSAPDGKETYAYTPEEASTILSHLTGQAHLAVSIALAAGLRKSEIRGLQLDDWCPATKTLSIKRAVWRNVVKTTKSKASRACVPIISGLADELNAYIAQNKPKCYLLETSSGRPTDLDNLAREVIAPALSGTGVKFRGWHAARRGLATYLHLNNVPDKEIQAVLRHSNIAVTMNSYVKAIPTSTRNAMEAVNYGGTK
jgi:integrase